MTAADPVQRAWQGAAYASCAVLLFAIMVSIVKSVAARYPLLQVVFCRNLFALLPLLPFLLRFGGLRSLRTGRRHEHLVRGAFAVAGAAGQFYAFSTMPLADATALSFTTPLFVTVLSAPLLGEPVGTRRWLSVAVGFLAVLVIVHPSGSAGIVSFLSGLGGSALTAVALIFVRKLSRTETNTTIVLYYSLSCIAISGLFMPFQWTMPGLADLMALVFLGVLGGLAHLFITQAYRLAPASAIAPLDYTAILWSTVLGWLLWSEVPSVWLFVGAPVVVGSALLAAKPAPELATATVTFPASDGNRPELRS